MSGSVLWSIGSPWNSYGLDALGSCITPDVSAAVPGQGQALDISFPEENIPMRVQGSSVFVLFYYTPSDETKNFGVPDTRITTATDSKCTKIGVSHCSDLGPPGSGSGHGYLPLPSFYAPGNSPFLKFYPAYHRAFESALPPHRPHSSLSSANSLLYLLQKCSGSCLIAPP